MSQNDSFIEEVSEAVRRDRLFRLFRKYGWIPIALVLLIVAGAAYNEWSKAQARAEAEARGSAILAALEAGAADERAAALAAIEAEGGAAAVVRMLAAAEAMASDDPNAAADLLTGIEAQTGLPRLYRDMATLKRVMATAAGTEPAERIAALEPLTAPGAPLRVLAQEQIALALLEQGDTEGALARLRALAVDTEASRGLRARVSRLMMALDGTPDAS